MAKDLAAFRRQPNGTVLHSLADADISGVAVTGTEKLAQKFLIKLLTEKKSVPYLADEGTSFISFLRSNAARTEADLIAAFSVAVVELARLFSATETGSEPANERFYTAKLNNIVFTPENVALNVTVESQARTAVVLTIPITVLV